MNSVNQEIINEIRSSIDIVDVISSYLPLTQKGKNYFGVCPFHDDNNPSMSVSTPICLSGSRYFFAVKYAISSSSAIHPCSTKDTKSGHATW